VERIPALYLRGLVEHESFRSLSESRDFLAANLDRVITLEEAANEACLSPFHYQRQFKRAFQESPHEFLSRLRMEKAKQLLAHSSMTVTEVCLEVGYESLGSFSSMFARLTGCPPTEFRRIYSMPTRWWLRNIPACMMVRCGITSR
jgi:AraC-like DNA-binding protein